MTEELCGGWSEPRDATEEIQKICDQVKVLVEAKTNKIYKEFKAVKYRSQVVAGMKYAIKVHVGGSSYSHLDIFEALPCYGGGIELIKVEENQTKDDPLNLF